MLINCVENCSLLYPWLVYIQQDACLDIVRMVSKNKFESDLTYDLSYSKVLEVLIEFISEMNSFSGFIGNFAHMLNYCFTLASVSVSLLYSTISSISSDHSYMRYLSNLFTS